SKDSDKYLLLGATLPTAGLALARFDFRGAGESGGSYRDATTATRIADLEAVLAFLAEQPPLSHQIGLLGSSMGGYVAWHVAHRRIQAGGGPPPGGRGGVAGRPPPHPGGRSPTPGGNVERAGGSEEPRGA